MIQPMSPTSVFEETRSESSLSSSDGQKDHHESETSAPDHPWLNGLRKLARVDAEYQHAARAQDKLKKPRKAGIKKSKRQASNIRSAEICRAAKGFYIQRLEQAIVQEEETCLQITKAKYDEITAIVQLKQKIQGLEKKKAQMEKKGLWVKTTSEEAATQTTMVDNVVDEFFVLKDYGNEPMKWEVETQNEKYFDEWDGNIELFINDDEMMCGGSDMDVPMTPPPADIEYTAPMTPENKKRFPVETSLKKVLRSPVSLLELAQEVPEGGSLRPCIAT